MAIRLEDVRKIKTRRDAVEKRKSTSSKPKSGSQTESTQKEIIPELKNNRDYRRRRRGRRASESISSSKPTKPEADKPDRKKDLSYIIYYNYGKKGYFANICCKSKKVPDPS